MNTEQENQRPTPEETKKVVGTLMEAMGKNFEENQQKPFQYVVAYKRIADDSVIGYHASTFCNTTKDLEKGKRYNGENPYKQLQTIDENFKHMMNVKEKTDSLFAPIHLETQKNCYAGLTYEQVYLEAVYLDEDTPPQRFVYKEITE
jgi:hypothetical protein